MTPTGTEDAYASALMYLLAYMHVHIHACRGDVLTHDLEPRVPFNS